MNGLNTLVRRQGLSKWIKKARTNYTLSIRFKNTNRLKVKVLEKKYQAKRAEMAVIISDKIDLKTKIITRDKISKLMKNI